MRAIVRFRLKLSELQVSGHSLEFIRYVRETFIFRGANDNKRPPLFPIHLWNKWRQVLDQLPLSNNAAEAFNRRWNAHFGSQVKPLRSKVVEYMRLLEEKGRFADER